MSGALPETNEGDGRPGLPTRGRRRGAVGVVLRIVVADNDSDALDLAVTDLRLEGHDVVAAVSDGRDALEACRELRPDVLVVDHRMPPGPSGVEVAEQVRAEHLPVRVIVYSNYQDRELVERVRAAGGTFLPKGSIRRLRTAVASPAPT